MEAKKLNLLLLVLFLLSSSCYICSSQGLLSPDFYSSSCPNVELLVSAVVRAAATSDSTVPGKLLRLLFHDCMVQGCDASVLIEGNSTERFDPANKSLGGFDVVESAKRLLEELCPRTVSCADILVLAARDAVALTGGASTTVALGRRDGFVSAASNVRPNILDTSFTVDQMAQRFSSKGLSLDDLVVLSGAHTIGLSHCNSFKERFQRREDGELDRVDSSLDRTYAMELSNRCSTVDANTNVTVSNDPVTAFLFDNQYYQNLVDGKGLFRSDSILLSDPRTKATVEELAQNRDLFFIEWVDSFLRLTSVGVKTGDEGEIRAVCGSVNS